MALEKEELAPKLDPSQQLSVLEHFLRAEALPEGLFEPVLRFLQQLQPKGELPPFAPVASRRHQERMPGDERAQAGQIPGCAAIGCGGKCCDVKPGNDNKISMSVAEWSAAKDSALTGGPRVNHLLEMNGTSSSDRILVACLNGVGDCSGCGPSESATAGYEPEDCSYYPFFASIDSVGGRMEISVATRGNDDQPVKCPLPPDEAVLHLPLVVTSAIKGFRSDLGRFLGAMDAQKDMVGYTHLDLTPFLSLTPDDMAKIFRAAAACSVARTEAFALHHEGVLERSDLTSESQGALDWATEATGKKMRQALGLIQEFLTVLKEDLACPHPIDIDLNNQARLEVDD